MMTLDRQADLANLMIAYKQGNLNDYLKILERCKIWMPVEFYNFYYNLSKSSLFTRKGKF